MLRTTPEPLLISARELAPLLGISVRTLWRLVAEGKVLAPVHLGGSTRWRLDEIRRWIDDGCPRPRPESN
ncbi:helix-turn-helix domain-containing protein [bacterium]|nr:helix-turn-helix domain-containing protein [bacterium]